jgi:signal transduction histidine kinase
MQLEQQRYINPASAHIFQGLGNIAKETYDEVRKLSKSLNSDVLENQGLLGTIEQEVTRMRQLDKYVVEWTYDNEPKLNKDQKVVVFRIFQEALNNIMKHSGAKNIKINIQSSPSFRFAVTDDGKGFSAAEMLASSKGAGLKNMIKRAELAKMTCKIDATLGNGATFILEESLN